MLVGEGGGEVLMIQFAHGVMVDVTLTKESNYTAKNYHLFMVDKNSIKQCFPVHTVHSCQQYCSALLHLFLDQQYCSILFTTMNNVAAQHCLMLFLPNLNKLMIFCRVPATQLESPLDLIQVVDFTGLMQVCHQVA